MDPGLLQGGWLNFLFQDDAAHYLNHSSNILMEVKAAGSQEAVRTLCSRLQLGKANQLYRPNFPHVTTIQSGNDEIDRQCF